MNTVLLIALTIAAPALKEKDRPPSLVGEWVAEKVVSNGQVDANPQALRYTFTGEGKWVVARDGTELEWKNRGYTVDAKAKLNTIDLTLDRGKPDAPKYVGIFRVEGDTLTLCMSHDKVPRPTVFESPVGAAIDFFVFKRVKKEESK